MAAEIHCQRLSEGAQWLHICTMPIVDNYQPSQILCELTTLTHALAIVHLSLSSGGVSYMVHYAGMKMVIICYVPWLEGSGDVYAVKEGNGEVLTLFGDNEE